MYFVNDPSWVDEDAHGHFAEDRSNGDRCAACHGEDYLGTRCQSASRSCLKRPKGKALVTLKQGRADCSPPYSIKDQLLKLGAAFYKVD